MRERLVGGDVIGAPGEVCCILKLLTSAGGAGDAGGIYLGEEAGLRQWEQTNLDRRGETSGVGNVSRLADLVAVQLGEAVDEFSVGQGVAEPEILAEVDDAYGGVERIFLEEFFA